MLDSAPIPQNLIFRQSKIWRHLILLALPLLSPLLLTGCFTDAAHALLTISKLPPSRLDILKTPISVWHIARHREKENVIIVIWFS